MIILGIDPGSRATGYGLIEVDGRHEEIITYDVIDVTDTDNHPLRLKRIYDRLLEVIEETCPDEFAVEMPVYAKNAQSMLKLGRAQAAAVLAALNREVAITEYTPKEIKKSVTGNGNASKKQVWYMVKAMLDLTDERGNDASDALAVALCHAHRLGSSTADNHRDWESFIQANPDRIES
jgi:crossover junction endodeoxyribonuclease RuvC